MAVPAEGEGSCLGILSFFFRLCFMIELPCNVLAAEQGAVAMLTPVAREECGKDLAFL